MLHIFSIKTVNAYMSTIGGLPDHRWSIQNGHPWKALMDVLRLALMCEG